LGARGADLIAISVEGKGDEPFGPTLDERRGDASSGIQERIAYLLDLLHLPSNVPGSIRYQLLHRTAAAIKAADQFRARQAVMLVHSFSQEKPHGKWFEDFQAFARLFGSAPRPDELVKIGLFGTVELHLGWCRGDASFLRATPQ
jgi:hypothetical protein